MAQPSIIERAAARVVASAAGVVGVTALAAVALSDALQRQQRRREAPPPRNS